MSRNGRGEAPEAESTAEVWAWGVHRVQPSPPRPRDFVGP